MAQKREIAFDSMYGGSEDVDGDEMLDGNRDLLQKNEDIEQEKKRKQLKDNELEINGNDYHITF